MQRRFHILSEFKPLDSRGIETLLQTYFSEYDFDQKNLACIERYNTVINAFRAYRGNDIISCIEEILKGRHGFMCQYEKGLNFETIWSSVFDLDTLDIYRAEGDPRRKKYISDERLKR